MANSGNNYWNGQPVYPQMGYSNGQNGAGYNHAQPQWPGQQNIPSNAIPRAMQYTQNPQQNMGSMESMGSYGNITAPLHCPYQYFAEDGPVLENGEAFASYTGMDLGMNMQGSGNSPKGPNW